MNDTVEQLQSEARRLRTQKRNLLRRQKTLRDRITELEYLLTRSQAND